MSAVSSNGSLVVDHVGISELRLSVDLVQWKVPLCTASRVVGKREIEPQNKARATDKDKDNQLPFEASG
jgi:hypothetical protein